MEMKVLCYGEPAIITDFSPTQYLIRYADDVIEWIDKDNLELQILSKLSRKQHTPLKRVNMRRVNPKRRKTAFKKHFGSSERVITINKMTCSVKGCYNTNIVNAHLISRGSGGTYKDIIPLCNTHHQEEHAIGTSSFLTKYGLNAEGEIKRVRTALGEI